MLGFKLMLVMQGCKTISTNTEHRALLLFICKCFILKEEDQQRQKNPARTARFKGQGF
jgi:hypothetical protein